jgi:hypothetical protein
MKTIIKWIFQGALMTSAGSSAMLFIYFGCCLIAEIPTVVGYHVLWKTFLAIACFLVGLLMLLVIGCSYDEPTKKENKK